MKNYYLTGILLAATIVISLIACKKSSEDPEVALTAQSLAGRYKLTELTAETSFSPPQDALGQLTECELDNEYELKADSTANYIDAGVQCEPAKNYSFKFDMTSNTVSLIGLQNQYFTGGTVKKFDGKTLILEAKVKSPQTFNQEVTVVGTLVRSN